MFVLIVIVVFIFQISLALLSLLIVFLLLTQNRKYLGNQFLSISLGFVAFYVFFIFIYKILNNATLMQYSIRISFSSLIIAVLFMYLTIEVLTHSVDVFKMQFKRYIPWIVLAVIIIGLII